MPFIETSLRSWPRRFPYGGLLDADIIIYALESLNELEWYQLLSDLLDHGAADSDIDRLFNTDRDFDILINISDFIQRATCPIFGLAADRLIATLLSDPNELNLQTLRRLLSLLAMVQRGPPWESIKGIALAIDLPVELRQFAAITLIDYNDRPSRSFWDDLEPRKNPFMLGPYVAAIGQTEPEAALALMSDKSIPDEYWLPLNNPMRQVIDSYIRKYGRSDMHLALQHMEHVGRERLQRIVTLAEFRLSPWEPHLELPVAPLSPASASKSVKKESRKADQRNRYNYQQRKAFHRTSRIHLIRTTHTPIRRATHRPLMPTW